MKCSYPVHLKLLNGAIKGWEPEFRFHPTRKWRFDFANSFLRVAVEIEGAIFAKKRLGHSTGAGIKKDMEKYNQATLRRGLIGGMGRVGG